MANIIRNDKYNYAESKKKCKLYTILCLICSTFDLTANMSLVLIDVFFTLSEPEEEYKSKLIYSILEVN